jgi:AcrR family transcriptional regulator
VTRRRIAEQRRKEILLSLYECLSSAPYHEITIKDIAKAANVSYGSLHYYFESKKDIVQAFVEEFVADHEAIFQNQAGTLVSAWDRLRKMVSFLSEEMIFNQKTNKVFLNLYHMGCHDEEIRQCMIRSYKEFRNVIADIIRYGISRGEFTTLDPDEFALFFVGTVEGLYLQETIHPGLCNKQRVEEVLNAIARWYLSRADSREGEIQHRKNTRENADNDKPVNGGQIPSAKALNTNRCE